MECDTKAMLTPCGHFFVNSNSKSCVQFSPVAQSCLTLHDPMDCSSPGLPIDHWLLEFTQTHVHGVGDAIQPSHPLSPTPCPPDLNLSQHHICMRVCVCAQKGLEGRDHLGEGRWPLGISTWKLSPSGSEHGPWGSPWTAAHRAQWQAPHESWAGADPVLASATGGGHLMTQALCPALIFTG